MIPTRIPAPVAPPHAQSRRHAPQARSLAAAPDADRRTAPTRRGARCVIDGCEPRWERGGVAGDDLQDVGHERQLARSPRPRRRATWSTMRQNGASSSVSRSTVVRETSCVDLVLARAPASRSASTAAISRVVSRWTCAAEMATVAWRGEDAEHLHVPQRERRGGVLVEDLEHADDALLVEQRGRRERSRHVARSALRRPD